MVRFVIVVSGALYVDPAGRDEYLAGCREVVEQARAAEGCLDFAIGADLLDAGRINVYERWESDEHLEAFRGSGPPSGQLDKLLDAQVQRYRISSVEAA
jgi:quinol monooxygenase YgiN